MNKRISLILCLALVAGACETSGDDLLVARAEDYELSVNQAVNVLVAAPQIPNDTSVMEAIAELWVDYTLLGEAARRDTTLHSVDLEPLVQQQAERRLILTLRDSVIRADTALGEDELRTLYQEESPGVTARARHILLTYPDSATAAQKDSVRRRAEELRERATTGGESFEELARQYSQDRGSAQQGGDLGPVERGQMMPAIDSAVFALEPGGTSDVIETPYGLHILRVDDRQEPSFEDIRADFRSQVQQRRLQQAESTYIAALVDESEVEPVDEAAELTKRMAANPDARLSGRAARRPVIRYDGGAVTLDEVLDFMQTSQPRYRGQVVTAPDSVVEDQVLLGIVQRELLLQRAREMGMEVPEAARDSLTRTARERFVEVARQLGVLDITPEEGQSGREAVASTVLSILGEMVSGEREVIPLGGIAYTLRKQFPNQVFETGIAQAVGRVAEARGTGPGGSAPPAPGIPPAPTASGPPAADTSGGA